MTRLYDQAEDEEQDEDSDEEEDGEEDDEDMSMVAAPVATKAAAAGSSHAIGKQILPSKADNTGTIIVLMAMSSIIVFIDHDRTGKPQNGNQYIAIGVVGFALLVLNRFWSSVALGLAALFTVSIILNSPNGVPFINAITPTAGSGAAGGVSLGGNSSSSKTTKLNPAGTPLGGQNAVAPPYTFDPNMS